MCFYFGQQHASRFRGVDALSCSFGGNSEESLIHINLKMFPLNQSDFAILHALLEPFFQQFDCTTLKCKILQLIFRCGSLWCAVVVICWSSHWLSRLICRVSECSQYIFYSLWMCGLGFKRNTFFFSLNRFLIACRGERDSIVDGTQGLWVKNSNN